MTRIKAAAGGCAHDGRTMVEIIEGWRCIGCGKVDAPRPCIGVCQDRRIELVDARDYAEALLRIEELEEALALIARVDPKPDAMQRSWDALQQRARGVLG